MSVSGTEAVTSGLLGQSANSTSTKSSAADKDMFLQLLVAQMKYQDPMNPTDSSQFLAQSAQFTALEKMQDVADQTAQLFSAQMAFGASGLIGQKVTWTDDAGATQSGTVGGVTFGADGPVLDVEGSSVPMLSVLSVGTTTPAATPAAP